MLNSRGQVGSWKLRPISSTPLQKEKIAITPFVSRTVCFLMSLLPHLSLFSYLNTISLSIKNTKSILRDTWVKDVVLSLSIPCQQTSLLYSRQGKVKPASILTNGRDKWPINAELDQSLYHEMARSIAILPTPHPWMGC